MFCNSEAVRLGRAWMFYASYLLGLVPFLVIMGEDFYKEMGFFFFFVHFLTVLHRSFPLGRF